ncbi:MAG: phosphoenolpyruvate-utilizing N-terminal domain-containing protein, partial [Planctomycetota bacterium]
MLEGVTVSAGVALGPVRIGGYELDRPGGVRIPKEQVESEVDRFHGAVERSRRQARDLRESLARDLGKEAQILEVHLAYLEDATFLKDVEDRIRGEQLPLEGALSRIVRDFDRIFELVENELLKERAIDLRDVALRLIRNLDETEPQRPEKGITRPFILATHKLSIVDMFDIDHERVLGVIAEEGGRNSHAGILARSMGIPALTGITGLRDQIRNEDFVILDSSSGVVYVNPETTLRKEYEIRAGESRGRTRDDAVHGRPRLADGLELEVLGSCGNLGDVSHSVSYGLEGIGLYRTELLFLLERSLPDEEKLFD